MQFHFSDHVLDVDLRELTRGGESVAVEPQVFDLLVHLIENRDHVVTKDDLIETVWDGRIVSESTLTSRINAARRAVGDSGKDQAMIRTIARKGFRFVGDVQPTAQRRRSARSCAAAARPHRRAAAPAAPGARSHRDRGAAVRQSFGRAGAGIFFRRHQRGHHHRAVEAALVLCDRAELLVHLPRKSVHHKQIGEDLGVGYVVEGSVRKDGDHVRIAAQLVDVATGSHLWAERYDRNLADVFAVQDEITQAVVAAIEPQLYAAEDFRARRKAPDNMDAWDLVMRALSHYWRVTRQDNLVAQALLEKAIAVDPDLWPGAQPAGGLPHFSAHMGWEDMSKAVPVAERAALAAIRADSEDAWAHYALASVYLFHRRFDDCLAEFELALRLNPEFLARARHLRRRAVLSRALGGGRSCRARGAEISAARSLCRDLLRGRRLLPVSRRQLRRGDPPVARSAAAAHRFRRRPPRADGRLGMAGGADAARAALQGLRRTQPGISLAWLASELPFEHEADKAHYLEGFRRAGLQ